MQASESCWVCWKSGETSLTQPSPKLWMLQPMAEAMGSAYLRQPSQ